MPPSTTPQEQPKPRETIVVPEVKLSKLAQEINAKRFKDAAETIVSFAMENGDKIDQKRIDAFVDSLTPEQQKALHASFDKSGENETNQKVVALHTKLDTLSAEVGGKQPERDPVGSGAQMVLSMIDKGVDALKERAGTNQSAIDKIEKGKNLVISMAPGIIEKIAYRLKNTFGDVSQILQASLELKLMQPKFKEIAPAYRLAYTDWAKNATPPPPDATQAVEFSAQKKTNAALTWETYTQTKTQPQATPVATAAPAATPVAQAKPAEAAVAQAQTAQKPAETVSAAPAQTPEKVNGQMEVTLADGKKISVIVSGNSVVAQVGQKKWKLDIANMPIIGATVMKPNGSTEKGTMEVDLGARGKVKVDLVALHDGLNLPVPVKEITTGDSTKVSLIDQTA
jgi:hypothetical protein